MQNILKRYFFKSRRRAISEYSKKRLFLDKL